MRPDVAGPVWDVTHDVFGHRRLGCLVVFADAGITQGLLVIKPADFPVLVVIDRENAMVGVVDVLFLLDGGHQAEGFLVGQKTDFLFTHDNDSVGRTMAGGKEKRRDARGASRLVSHQRIGLRQA